MITLAAFDGLDIRVNSQRRPAKPQTPVSAAHPRCTRRTSTHKAPHPHTRPPDLRYKKFTLKFGFPRELSSRFSVVLATIRRSATIPASFGDEPLRMASTIMNEHNPNKFASPRPVEPAAPPSPATYSPAPRIGESPTRPGIFHAKPLVVVTPHTSPLRLNPLQLI